MLRDEKILITGAPGQIAFPLCAHLAPHNEVWGIARYSRPGSRAQVEALGVTTRAVDLGDGDFGDLPDDFTLVLHLAAYLSPGRDYDEAMRVNAEGTGLLLTHCRTARAALVMSTISVHDPHPDPWHAFTESDPLGEVHLAPVPTYSSTKIGQEAVARTCARTLGLPVVIARMNVAYGRNGGLPAYQLDAIMSGTPIPLRSDPNPISPIHQDDIDEQVEALLGAASVPATIVHWAGDEVVSTQDWCRYMGELVGREPQLAVSTRPGTMVGLAADVTRRAAITGPCRVDWRTGIRDLVETRYPGSALP